MRHLRPTLGAFPLHHEFADPRVEPLDQLLRVSRGRTATRAVALTPPDMYLAVPGLAFRESTASRNGLAIRGVVAPTQGASVMGVYVDNTPVTGGRMQQISGAVFDVARVEVLQGPQGTLYGEGAMGGTLRYITNRPDPQALAARVKAEYSQIDYSDDPSYVISGVVNVPLDDRLALRVSGQYRDRADYMDALETRNEKDVNWRQDLSIRARIESVVSDALVVNGSISY